MRKLIYIASRASLPERSELWRKFRREGIDIISSWIDEAGKGETEDFQNLWERIYEEIFRCDKLVLYAETEDFPLKGALVEVGIALGMCKPVTVVLPGVKLEGRTFKPIGSWIKYPSVTRNDDIEKALQDD